MDKRSEPVGIRFRNSILNALQKELIKSNHEQNRSELLDELLDFVLYIRAYRYPFCKENTPENGNGQGNDGRTL